MNRPLLSQRGQFVPIAAMVMFTSVVFMVAAVNVYKVASAKLKMQNVADAVALDIAAREASSLNWIADRNEWLNHMYADSTSPTDAQNPCPANMSSMKLLPGLSCVEYVGGNSYTFNSQTGAAAYGRLVKSVNDAQTAAYKAFNSFIGANGGNNQLALEDILRKDITEFSDPSFHIVTWNTAGGENAAAQQVQNTTPGNSSNQRVTAHMVGLQYQVHNIKASFQTRNLFGARGKDQQQTFSQLLKQSDPVGWMALDLRNSPTMNVRGKNNQTQTRMGAGAWAYKTVTVLGKPILISAHAVAYVVPGSGNIPLDANVQGSHPIFKPTYWVKLVTPYGN